MLKHLHIQNIILVEKAELSFTPGLNILTGETGSGKSAIMHGLRLAFGERADSTIVRKGCEKGAIEAVFEIEHPSIFELLQEGGIELDPHHDLVIRREISANGKGRIFINHQMAQLSFLRKLGVQLIQSVGQHANQNLLSLDYHRQVVDLHGDLQDLAKRFEESFDKENGLKQALIEFKQQESHRLREIDVCKRELEELEEAAVKEGEEEELFAEYTLLTNSEEMSSKIHDINQALNGERVPLFSILNRQKHLLDSLVSFDPSLQQNAESLQNAILELQDVAHSLEVYHSRLHFDADRLEFINQRLTTLNRLKRKYGNSVEEIVHYQQHTLEKLQRLENRDLELEKLEIELALWTEKTEKLACELTLNRKEHAAILEQALTHELRSLNMTKAEFSIQITPQKRSRSGDERIEFFLCPNVGERAIPLKDGASGGEISRVLLALQTLLAGKEKIGTLIFDEVDANIGGETATIIGQKLKKLSQQHQVICITHFPQVATQADHHLQILKEEKEGRTLTLVQELRGASLKTELTRMKGLKNLASL